MGTDPPPAEEHPAIQTNTFVHLSKYILQFGQIQLGQIIILTLGCEHGVNCNVWVIHSLGLLLKKKKKTYDVIDSPQWSISNLSFKKVK